LSAALLLLVLPTTGRMLHASAADAPGSVAQHGAHRGSSTPQPGHHAHRGHAVRDGDESGGQAPHPRPATGPDCDYCPLLASLVATARVPFAPQAIPAASASLTLPATPRLPWLHPNGLGSRGPPLHG